MNRTIATICVLFAAAAAVPNAHAGDFNGDGRDDVVVLTTEDVTATGSPIRMLHVLYGSSGGLTVTGNQFFVEPTTDDVEPRGNSVFGESIATGDFDGDGFDDFVASAREAKVDGVLSAGVVYEFRGSSTGVSFRRVIHQNRDGITDKCEEEDRFGLAIAAGDFDGDGRDDLAVGVLEKIDGKKGAGAVQVIYGTKNGLGKHDEMWHQNRSGVKDKAEKFEGFGNSLAAGDLDGDGFDDIVIEVFEARTHGDRFIQNAIAVLYGDDDGITSSGDRLFDEIDLVPDLDPEAVELAGFANAMVVGDFDGDGDGDLVIADHFFGDLSTNSLNGAIRVVQTVNGKLAVDQTQSFVSPEKAQLGNDLAVGDFNGDGKDDLAVGAPAHAVSMQAFAGVVFEFQGTAQGLALSSPILWSQATGAIPGDVNAFDLFGRGVGAGDFDGDGKDDIAVGVPAEDVAGQQNAGQLQTIYGVQSIGLTDADAQFFTQTMLGNGQLSQQVEQFGAVVKG